MGARAEMQAWWWKGAFWDKPSQLLLLLKKRDFPLLSLSTTNVER